MSTTHGLIIIIILFHGKSIPFNLIKDFVRMKLIINKVPATFPFNATEMDMY